MKAFWGNRGVAAQKQQELGREDAGERGSVTGGTSGVRVAATASLDYRRDDSIGMAGRLHDRLAHTFGRAKLFMDVDHIPVGTDNAGLSMPHTVAESQSRPFSSNMELWLLARVSHSFSSPQ